MHECGQPVIYVMVGIPGSGKSNYRDSLVVYGEQDVVVISSDDFIEWMAMQAGRSYNEIFKEAVGEAARMTDVMLDYAIKHNRNIVWDQTNLSVAKRAAILAKVPSNYKRVAIFFNVDLEIALERNRKRERTISEGIIRNMHESLVSPTTDEGFHTIVEMHQ